MHSVAASTYKALSPRVELHRIRSRKKTRKLMAKVYDTCGRNTIYLNIFRTWLSTLRSTGEHFRSGDIINFFFQWYLRIVYANNRHMFLYLYMDVKIPRNLSYFFLGENSLGRRGRQTRSDKEIMNLASVCCYVRHSDITDPKSLVKVFIVAERHLA